MRSKVANGERAGSVPPVYSRSTSPRAFHLYRYITQEFLLSFLVSFAFFFFMFFINQLLLLAEDILQKDVSLIDVLRLIVFSLPSIVALSVPFATLVGALMAVGRLSSDNEIVAMQALGFPIRRLFLPVLLPAILLAFLSFTVNDFLLPLGTLNFGKLYRQLLYSNPALELDPYSVKRYRDDVLITGALEPGRLDNFVIIDSDTQGDRRVIVADEALLDTQSDENVISLDLRNVTSHTHVNEDEYHLVRAERLVYNILLQDITIAIRSPGPREMSARAVRDVIGEKETLFAPRLRQHARRLASLTAQAEAMLLAPVVSGAPPEDFLRPLAQRRSLEESPPTDRSLQIYRLEYHKKYSIPFAAVSFVVLAFPLGLYSRRSGRSVGFGLGLLISTVYWALLIGGQTFGTQRPNVPPALAMWLPNVVFLIAGLVVFVERFRR